MRNENQEMLGAGMRNQESGMRPGLALAFNKGRAMVLLA